MITEKSRPANVCDDDGCVDSADETCHPFEVHSSSKISALLFEMNVISSISFFTCVIWIFKIDRCRYNLYTDFKSKNNHVDFPSAVWAVKH